MARLRQKGPRDPSPARHTVLEYPTPNIGDMIFYVLVDSRNKKYSKPEYGSKYPSKDGEYVDHELVMVVAADQNGWTKHYYAAPRINESHYNFQYIGADLGRGFDSYTRSYVVKREDVGEWFNTTVNPVASVGVLTFAGDTSDHKLGIEIDGDIVWFRVGTGVFVGSAIIYTAPISSADAATAVKEIINGEVSSVAGVTFEYVTAGLFSGITASVNGSVVTITSNVAGIAGDSITTISTLTNGSWGAATLEGGADETAIVGSDYLLTGSDDPDVSFNPEWTNFDFTGQKVVRIQDKELDSLYVLIERKFSKICQLDSLVLNPTTGALVPYSELLVPKGTGTTSDTDPATGESTIRQAHNCEWDKLVTSISNEGGAVGESMSGWSWNASTCEGIVTGSVIVPAGTVGSVPDSDGVYCEVTPINTLFSRKTCKVDPNYALKDVPLTGAQFSSGVGAVVPVTKTIISSAGIPTDPVPPDSLGNITEYNNISSCLATKIERNIKPIADLTYSTSIPYAWPAVYGGLNPYTWRWLNGSYIVYGSPYMAKEKWSGLCRASVHRYWTLLDDSANNPVETMTPTAMIARAPFMTVSVPPSLHGDVTIPISSVGGFRGLINQQVDYDFIATAHLDWPDSLVVSSTSSPAAGGYINEVITVFKPV